MLVPSAYHPDAAKGGEPPLEDEYIVSSLSKILCTLPPPFKTWTVTFEPDPPQTPLQSLNLPLLYTNVYAAQLPLDEAS